MGLGYVKTLRSCPFSWMAIHFIQSARYRIEQETGIDPKKKASLFVPKREALVARRGPLFLPLNSVVCLRDLDRY